MNKVAVSAFLFLLFVSPKIAKAEDCDSDDLLIATSSSLPLAGLSLRQHRTAMSTLPASTQMVLIGDSMAHLWPRDQLVRRFGENVANLGIRGDRTQNILLRLGASELRSIAPKDVVLIVGTNNLSSRNKPCAIAAGIEKIAGKIHGLWPSARIRIFDVPPRGPNLDTFDAERRSLNAYILKISDSYPYVDVKSTDGLKCDEPKLCVNYRPDMLHPSQTGYEWLTQQLSVE